MVHLFGRQRNSTTRGPGTNGTLDAAIAAVQLGLDDKRARWLQWLGTTQEDLRGQAQADPQRALVWTAPTGDPEGQEFADTFEQLLTERFGHTSVPLAEALTLVETLIGEAEQGAVPHHGQIHHIAPVVLDPTERATIQAGTQAAGGIPKWVQAVGMIGGALLVAFMLIMVLFPQPAGHAALPPRTPPVGSGSPVAGATEAPPTAAPSFVTVAGQVLPEVQPNTLDLDGRTFLVYPAPVVDKNWVIKTDPAVVNWLPGASTNWTFLIVTDPTDAATTRWVAGLGAGRPAVLRVSADSGVHQFQLTSRRRITRTQTEFGDPHRPGLTVLLKAAAATDDARILLQGVEVVRAAGTPAAKGGDATDH